MDIFNIIKILLFCFVLYGYFSFVARNFKIDQHFIPVFVCSLLAIIVFFAGLLNLLLYSAYLIWFCGFCFACYSLFLKIKNGMVIPSVSIFQVGFCGISFFFLVLLLKRNFIHYDNFTHWALVVKEMLVMNAFPTADSLLVTFNNYPLGSSSFVYLVCRLTDHTQGIMLFAQGILVFSCFYGIFGIIEQKRRFLLTIFLATGLSYLSFFNLTVRIDNLLVDFLLATLTLVCFSCIYRYRNKLNQMLIVTTPMIALLLITKNTGIFYVGMIYVYMIYNLIHYRHINTSIVIIYMRNYTVSKRNSFSMMMLKLTSSIILAFSTYLVWEIHVDYYFSDIEHKFEVNLSSLSLMSDKTNEQIQQIISLYIDTLFDYVHRSSLGILCFEILGLTMCIVGAIWFKGKWRSLKIFIASNISLCIYLSGILTMYVFIMPYEEAMYLAGYQRYISTMVIVILGVLWMNLTINIENSFYYKLGEVDEYKSFKSIQTKKLYSNGIIVCLLMIIFILSSEYNGIIYNDELYPNSVVAQLERIVGDSWKPLNTETSYLIYVTDTDQQVTNNYVGFAAQYFLYATNVKVVSNPDEFIKLYQDYDYMVILEEDDMIQREFGTKLNEDIVGMYEVDAMLVD